MKAMAWKTPRESKVLRTTAPRVTSRISGGPSAAGVAVGRPPPSQVEAVPGNAALVAAAPEAQHGISESAVATVAGAAMEALSTAEKVEDASSAQRLVPLAHATRFP